MAGMHFYDFETQIPSERDIYDRLVECKRREDLLYSYARTRIAEVDGSVAGSLLSYPGDIYREMREKTFRELWPDFFKMDQASDQEADPGEYYLDTLAVLPQYRRRGISGREEMVFKTAWSDWTVTDQLLKCTSNPTKIFRPLFVVFHTVRCLTGENE